MYLSLKNYDAIVLAVGHDEFKNLVIKKESHQVIYDVKSILDKDIVDERL